MKILLCSVGRRCELIKNIRNSADLGTVICATDVSITAPALYFADKKFIVPSIDDDNYLSTILDICKTEKIQAITTFIDPEIEILAANRKIFAKMGVEVLAPYEETAKYCFDKYKMYLYLNECGIATPMTFGDIESFKCVLHAGKINFPIFVKPRTGSGSVGARKVYTIEHLEASMKEDNSLIVQEYMDCIDIDADVYIDTISHNAVSAFLKKKLETKIGGASKTISFKDERLFGFIKEIVTKFKFNGPVDMDFFYRDGKYYLSEINPRFGGAYLHAYGAGVDFIKLIINNINGIQNKPCFGNYEEGVVMMMYDSVVIEKIPELL